MPLSEYVQANLAQAFVNVLFGSASVINMIGLQNFDPVVYGLIRAVLTTVLLVALRWDQRLVCCSANRVQPDDVARFCAAALCLFVGCVLSSYARARTCGRESFTQGNILHFGKRAGRLD